LSVAVDELEGKKDSADSFFHSKRVKNTCGEVSWSIRKKLQAERTRKASKKNVTGKERGDAYKFCRERRRLGQKAGSKANPAA